MKNTVRNLIMLGCVGSSAFAAPFLAIGDNAELFVTGQAGARYDDNINLAPSNTKSDTIMEFAPGFDLEFGKTSLVKGALIGSESFTDYLNHSEFNTQLASIAFNAKYDNDKTKLSTKASYDQLSQNTYAANGATVRRDTGSAGVNGEYAVSPKTSLGAGFVFTNLDYHSTGYADEKDYSVPLSVYYGITPKVDLSAGLTYTRSDLSNGASYDDYYYNVGARGEFTPKLTGSFSVGLDDRKGSGGSVAVPVQDTTGLGFHAGLSYLYSEKTTFTLDTDKGFTSSGTGTNTQKNLGVTLGGQTDIAADWKLNAALAFRNIQYVGVGAAGREDNYVSAVIGATYVINTNVSVTGSYTWRENASNVPAGPGDPEFKNNVVALSVSARY